MAYFPKELFIELLEYDVLSINTFKLLNKEINQMIKLYLTFLLTNKSYLTINLDNFRNKVFLNNVLNNFLNNFLINPFIDNGNIIPIPIPKNMDLYTFIYDLTSISETKNIICNNIFLFFERRCRLYAKLSLEKDDFSIYKQNVEKMKKGFKYIDKIYLKMSPVY